MKGGYGGKLGEIASVIGCQGIVRAGQQPFRLCDCGRVMGQTDIDVAELDCGRDQAMDAHHKCPGSRTDHDEDRSSERETSKQQRTPATNSSHPISLLEAANGRITTMTLAR